MNLVIGLLTFILVLNCLFLMLLVLIQLPKKEAGAGLAFGGGASDALFGAGSGNALTNVTKYVATTFLGLALVLAVLNSRRHDRESMGIQEELSRQSTAGPMVTQPAPAAEPQQLTVPPAQTTTPAPLLTPAEVPPAGTTPQPLPEAAQTPAANATPPAATPPAESQE